MKGIRNFKKYQRPPKLLSIFQFFTQVSFLIIEFYTRDNDIEYIEHDCVERLIDQYLDSANCFEDILDQIESIKVENMSKK